MKIFKFTSKPVVGLLYLILFHCFVYNSLAQEVQRYHLAEAIEVAKANNLSLKGQEIDVSIAEEQVKEVYADGLPQVNGFWNYQNTIINAFAQRTGDPVTFMPSGNTYGNFDLGQSGAIEEGAFTSIGQFFAGLGDAFAANHTSNAGINLNQQLFDGVYLVGLKAARTYVDLSKVQTKTTERDIEKSVEKAYIGVLIMDENIKMIDKNIEVVNQLLREAQAIYEAGFIEQLDVDRLMLAKGTLRNQRNSILQLKEFNLHVLKNTMSIPLDTSLELLDDIATFSTPAVAGDILSEVNNPELWPEFLVLEAQENLQRFDIDRFKKARYPKVDLSVTGAMNYQSADFMFTNGFSTGWEPNVIAGVDIGIPIFDGNRRKSRLRQAELALDKIAVSRKSLEQTVSIQIQNALTSYVTAKNELQNQKENSSLAEKIFNTTQIKYKEGVGSSLELNQARQELYVAQQGYINSLYDLLIAQVDLEQALGK